MVVFHLLVGQTQHWKSTKAFLYGEKNYQGRVLPQQWVFGGICRETSESFMYAAPDRNAVTLLPIIQGAIRQGTVVISDLWRAYGVVCGSYKMQSFNRKSFH